MNIIFNIHIKGSEDIFYLKVYQHNTKVNSVILQVAYLQSAYKIYLEC
jgi:hypothetical protein